MIICVPRGIQLRHAEPRQPGERRSIRARNGQAHHVRFCCDLPTTHGREHESPAINTDPSATANEEQRIPMLSRPSTSRTLAAISGALWAWSWYIMYLEIHRWNHVTRSFRFNPPPPIPGTGIRPGPGLPLKALYVCAAGAPTVFLATLIAGIARTHQQPAAPVEDPLTGGLGIAHAAAPAVNQAIPKGPAR